MQINYWTSFSKRKNSTKQPTGGTQVNVALKNPCSILNPTFETSSVSDTVNYVQAFGNYYFVTDVTHLTEQTIQITCAIDAMATAKAQIGSTRAYVEYTSSSSNQTIPDGRNRPTTEILTKYNNLGTLGSFNASASCYVVGVASNAGVNYYMMDKNKFALMMGRCFDQGFIGQLLSNFYDLKNILVSACVMPRWPLTGTDDIQIDHNSLLTLADNVYKITDTDRMITLYEDTKDIYYPSDDITGLSGQNYLDAAPFSTGILFLPFVGCVELDVSTLASQKSVYIKATLDQMTGDIVYKVGLDANKIIATYSGSCAANIPISGSSWNAVGAAGGVAGIIGGAGALVATIASEGSALAVMGAAGAIAGSAGATVTSLQHHTQTNGSLSSFVGASNGLDIIATVITQKPGTTDLQSFKTSFGMPYFKCAQIGTLSGYVKCSGASVDLPGLDQIRDEVNGYLNSGFFYE